ncbi:hypothetical protein SLE2022_126170 [Rubroshorea leprosula]
MASFPSHDTLYRRESNSDHTDVASTVVEETQTPIGPPTHLSFNQDASCFTICTDSGFYVFSTDPMRRSISREFGKRRGLGHVAMFFQSNLFVLVGGGSAPLSPPTKAFLWDDRLNGYVGELTFRSHIRSLRLLHGCVIVVLLQKIYIYNLSNFKLSHQVETVCNPKGLCEVSHAAGPKLMVCPGLQKGQVRVEHYGLRKTKFINAHNSPIACLALTSDGRVLATASSKGTLIRVFNSLDGTLLQELRRGADQAEIYSLAFSSPAHWLAVSSNKGTVHIFRLKFDSESLLNDGSNNPPVSNLSKQSAVSSFSMLKGALPKYFSSEWSVARFWLPEGLKHLVAFGKQKNTIFIIGMDGSFYRCKFDPERGGNMTQLEHHNFLVAS